MDNCSNKKQKSQTGCYPKQKEKRKGNKIEKFAEEIWQELPDISIDYY